MLLREPQCTDNIYLCTQKIILKIQGQGHDFNSQKRGSANKRISHASVPRIIEYGEGENCVRNCY